MIPESTLYEGVFSVCYISDAERSYIKINNSLYRIS